MAITLLTTSDVWTIKLRACEKYIRKIRNERKRAYAVAFLLYANGQGPAREPSRGELSFMAAQAVRNEIYKILRGEE